MSDAGQAIGDAAENSSIDNAVEIMARTRASTFLRMAAQAAEDNPWLPGAVTKWLSDDRAQLIIDTNQGRFVVTISRG